MFDTFTLELATSGVETNEILPAGRSGLGAVYPNPLNPNTRIAFELDARHNVDLSIYDLRGKLIRQLVVGEQLGAGQHKRNWNGEDHQGNPGPC